MKELYAIHWFRRDLRTAGNPALQKAWKQYHGRVLGLFCFDKKFLARPDFSVDRFQFFLKTLEALRNEFREAGGEILVLDIGPDDAFEKLFSALKAQGKLLPDSIFWNRDYEPFALARDQRIEKWLRAQGIHTHVERDHVLIEPHEIQKKSDPDKPFQVFTPYSKVWLEKFQSTEVQERVENQAKGLHYLHDLSKGRPKQLFQLTWKTLLGTPLEDVFEQYLIFNSSRVRVPIPEAGSLAAYRRLLEFKNQIEGYKDDRDFPAIRGTSGFSIFLKNGSLTLGQIIAALGLKAYSKNTSSSSKFLSELIWREFYYYILTKFPHVETQSFNPKYRNLRWENREDRIAAWMAGQTGFPIVDAGMRQLLTTGWMHNRVRMIVASFLTKDLLVDWQMGERYFMEKLLDGDLAPNNGGWQWAASTGCDPQPYFRIFNPYLQSKKFDPEGIYIKKYVPELRHLNANDIHEPPPLERGDYPPAIVDHGEQRELALKLYAEGT